MNRGAWLLVCCLLAVAAPGCDTFGEEDCSSFDDEPAVGATFRILNQGSRPLKLTHVGNCVASQLFSLELESEPLPSQTRFCSGCATRRDIGGGCNLACEVSSVIVIHPGANHDLRWDGTMRVERSLPDRCGGNGLFDTCEQNVAAPAGTYEVTVTAFAEHQCFDGTACSCGAEGMACVLPNSSVVGAGFVQSATFEHCPTGRNGCQPQVVELVFK